MRTCDDDDDDRAGLYCISFTVISVTSLVLICLYTSPNTPMFSIEEFSVPAFNKTSDYSAGDVYLDLKLRNMNKAIGLYYDDPFTLALFYYPFEESNQKYVWEFTFPPFYQNNGKTNHIIVTTLENQDSLVRTPTYMPPVYQSSKIRSLLENHLELPIVDKEDSRQTTQGVNFRINVMVNYRFKLLGDSSTHGLEVGADVMVDANSGERVSKGSIKLVESSAQVVGGPIMIVLLFTSFVLMSI